MIIASYGLSDPEKAWSIALNRTEETLLGVFVVLLVTGLFWPRYAQPEFLKAVNEVIRESVTISLVIIEWLHPPGGTIVPSSAWIVVAVTTFGAPIGDLRLFTALFRTAIYGALITLGMFFLAPAISDYWVMNLVVFSVLFLTGFAAARKVGFPFWMGSVTLLVSAIVGLNAQVAVDAKLIVDTYLGVMTGLTIGAVISRLVWPRLPQKLFLKKLVAYFAACEKILGETPSERTEQLCSEITLYRWRPFLMRKLWALIVDSVRNKRKSFHCFLC